MVAGCAILSVRNMLGAPQSGPKSAREHLAVLLLTAMTAAYFLAPVGEWHIHIFVMNVVYNGSGLLSWANSKTVTFGAAAAPVPISTIMDASSSSSKPVTFFISKHSLQVLSLMLLCRLDHRRIETSCSDAHPTYAPSP